MKESFCAGCPLIKNRRMMPTKEKEPDILLVTEYPEKGDFEWTNGRWSTPRNKVMSYAIRQLQSKGHKLTVAHTYAWQCEVPWDNKSRKCHVPPKAYGECSKLLQAHILEQKPKAILIHGDKILNALGIKNDFGPGTLLRIQFTQEAIIPVMPTFSLNELKDKDEFLNLYLKDMANLLELSKGIRLIPDYDIKFIFSASNILALVTDILEMAEIYHNNSKKLFGLPCVLLEERPGFVTIAIAFKACEENDKQYAFAFPLEQPNNIFTETESSNIRNAVNNLFSSPHIAIITCDSKNFISVLKNKYDMEINIPQHDLSLAGHLIHVENQGYYGINDLSIRYVPQIGHRLLRLTRELEEKTSSFTTQCNDELGNNVEKIRAVALGWLELEKDKRHILCEGFLKKGYLDEKNIQALLDVGYKNKKSKHGIPKKYHASLEALIENVPEEELAQFASLQARMMDDDFFNRKFIPYRKHLLHLAATQAIAIREIAKEQINELQEMGKFVASVPQSSSPAHLLREALLPMSKILGEIESKGIKFDRALCASYIKTLEQEQEEIENDLFKNLGYNINPNNDKEVAHLVYCKLRCPLSDAHKTDHFPVNEHILLKYAKTLNEPLLEKIVQLRKINNGIHNFLQNWQKCYDKDGYLHPTFNQTGTSTGRLSCSRPALQQLPDFVHGKNMKALFLPDNESLDIYNLDISAADLRVLAAYSGDERLIDAFNKGKDIHALTASTISGYDYEDICAHKDKPGTAQHDARSLAKKINFGIAYGITPNGLKNHLSDDAGLQKSLDDCKIYMENFNKAYPSIESYINNIKRSLYRSNMITTYFGRFRRFPQFAYLPDAKLDKIIRKGINFPIQSTASDLVMFNMISLAKWLKMNGGRILLTVHDSIVFQLPKNIGRVKDDIANIITENTKKIAPWLPVEWKFDLSKGPNYGLLNENVE